MWRRDLLRSGSGHGPEDPVLLHRDGRAWHEAPAPIRLFHWHRAQTFERWSTAEVACTGRLICRCGAILGQTSSGWSRPTRWIGPRIVRSGRLSWRLAVQEGRPA